MIEFIGLLPVPVLNTYGPGHCWYYKLGGRILPVDEIERPGAHTKSWTYDLVKGKKYPREKVEEWLNKALQDLGKDIDRYKFVVAHKEEAAFPWEDPFMAYYTSLSLCHNHISYNKGRVWYYQNIVNNLHHKAIYTA